MKPFEPSDSLIILAIVVIVLISILTGCSSPSEPSKATKQMELEAEIHSMKEKLDKGITPIHDDNNCHIPH